MSTILTGFDLRPPPSAAAKSEIHCGRPAMLRLVFFCALIVTAQCFGVQAASFAAEALNDPTAHDADGVHSGPSYFSISDDCYAVIQDGEVIFALVVGKTAPEFGGPRFESVRRIRAEIVGDFIYYERSGISYVLQDPTIVARAAALYVPMKDLRPQQHELDRRAATLRNEQSALTLQAQAVKIPAADYRQDIVELENALQKLKRAQSSQEIDISGLAALQGELGQIQGHLGQMQREAGERQSEIGAKENAVGIKQGEIGKEQGKIGQQQELIAAHAQSELAPLLIQAIRDGRAVRRNPIE